MRSFYFLILLIVACVDSQNSTTNSSKLLQQIKSEFNRRTLEPSLVIQEDELFCECTGLGCDRDVTDIIGLNFTGICRAHKDGVCYKAIRFDDEDNVKDYSLSCIASKDLVPPGRPFVCESVKNSKQKIECCSNASFCNHFEIPKEHTNQTSYSIHWYILLILIVAIVFSAAGLLVGIFWCKSDSAKQILREFIGNWADKRIHRSASSDFEEEGARLKGLLDDLEYTTRSTGSGVGIPSLTERTISHQITLHNIIGQGRFGEVFLGEWRGDKVAVKIFISREEASWQRETEIYRTNMLRHSNILRWISSDNKDTGTATQLWLISEYCPLGSLYEYLGSYEINQVLAVQFIRSCVIGLAYLHTEVAGNNQNNRSTKPGIAHRDIKSRNILIKADLTCVIADLGLAVRSSRGEIDLPANSRGGTMRYSAPEFLTDSYSEDSFDSYTRMDVYALSLVIWEICRRVTSDEIHCCFNSYPREVPYFEYVLREPTFEDMRECVVLNNLRPTIHHEWQTSPIMRELVRIMCECWSADPNSRLPSLNIRFALDKLIRNQNLKLLPE